jgi:hypothetical protein
MEKGVYMAYGFYVTDLDEVVAYSDLKDELKSKMKEGDEIVAFGYTDYGGSFGDKVAIEYFKENHPKNIVFENSAYNGQNGIVFGEVAKDFLEQTEDYPLGYEDMESFYYEMQNAQEEKDFEYFLSDIKDKYTVKKDAIDWLLENKSGYYSIQPDGLDFSYSELENELEEEGLIKRKKMEKGGYMAKGGSIRTLYKQFNQEKPNILLIMIADDVASDFMREKFDKTVDWSKLSDSEKEKYNEDYRVNKTSFENYLMSEFVKLYYSDDSIKEKCKGSSHKTIDSIKSVMKDLAKKYSQDKYAKGGISQKEVAESNAEMVLSQIKAVKHHAEELSRVVSTKADTSK